MGGGGAGGQRRARQEDQCNEQGKVPKGTRVQKLGSAQREESLWKPELRAAILSRGGAWGRDQGTLPVTASKGS